MTGVQGTVRPCAIAAGAIATPPVVDSRRSPNNLPTRHANVARCSRVMDARCQIHAPTVRHRGHGRGPTPADRGRCHAAQRTRHAPVIDRPRSAPRVRAASAPRRAPASDRSMTYRHVGVRSASARLGSWSPWDGRVQDAGRRCGAISSASDVAQPVPRRDLADVQRRRGFRDVGCREPRCRRGASSDRAARAQARSCEPTIDAHWDDFFALDDQAAALVRPGHRRQHGRG